MTRRSSFGAFAFVFAAGRFAGGRLGRLRHVRPSGGSARMPRTAASGTRACSAAWSQRSRVPEFLHSSDVGPSFQEMRGERMPKGMRSDPPPREQTPRILFHHRTHVAPGEGLPPAVEEHGRPVLTRHGRPSGRQVRVECLDRVVGHRDLALLVALPADQHAASIQVDLRSGEARHLADTQPRPVQQLEDRPVPEHDRGSSGSSSRSAGAEPSGASASSAASRGRRTVGSRFTALGEPRSAAGSRVHRARGERPPIERADGADPPGDRARAYPSACCCAR